MLDLSHSLIALGLHTDRFVSIGTGLLVDREAAVAFGALARRASAAGFDLRALSAFRDYDRQNQIIAEKWGGGRPVTDDEGRALDRGSSSDAEWRDRILRFSALPGTSRHHWGTDLDIWDAAAVSNAYRPMLSPAEYGGDGVFANLTAWLDERIAADDAEGFYKPYAIDRGGVAPEAWHISYRPVAMTYQDLVTPDMLLSLWRGEPDPSGVRHEPLAMLSAVESEVGELLARFVATV